MALNIELQEQYHRGNGGQPAPQSRVELLGVTEGSSEG